MSQYWFVDRDADGNVANLLRLTHTDSIVRGETLRDGHWHESSDVLGWMFDRGMGGELDPHAGRALAIELGADPLREGFAGYFVEFDLRLPDPIPAVGLVREGGWDVRYRLADGDTRLDFLALNPHTTPVHGEVRADGEVVLHDTYRDHFVVGPDATAAEADAAEAALDAHNERVTAELERKGLA